MSKCRAGEADSFCVARLHKLGATDFRSERVRTTDAQTPAISIRGLTKQYGSLTALKDLNLEVVQGEVLGFLGLYSTGMKRKLGLIQAFQADPPLLILDEPTEGLDPLMQESFYVLLQDAKQKGRTVFMSSHVLSEVERVCDRIALLRKGELVLLSSMEASRQLAPRRIRVFFKQDVRVPPDLPPGHEFVETFPQTWHLNVVGPLGPLLAVLARLPVKDLEVQEARLEDVVLKYYREGAS